MKKIILAAAFICLVAVAGFAQAVPREKNTDNKKEIFKGDRDRFHKELGLTNQQEQQLQTLREENRAQMQAIKNDNTLTQEQKKEKIKSLQQSRKAKHDAILTPEQRAKVNARMEQMRNNPNQRQWNKNGVRGNQQQLNKRKAMSRKSGMMRGNAMKELNLTANQQEQMIALQKEMREKRKAIADNASLTQEQKKAAFREAATEVQQKRKNIFTAEQLTQWETMRQQRSQQRRQAGTGA